MEHPAVKEEAAIQHGIGEKTSLAKKSVGGFKSAARTVGKGAAAVKGTVTKVAANPVVKTGGRMVSMVGSAVGNAIDKIDNSTVQVARKSYIVAKSAVRLGGKTVKISGKVIKNTVKLSRFVAQKVRLAKKKDKSLKKAVDTSKLQKIKKAAIIANKYALKPAAKVVKGAGRAADTVIDRVASNIDNDTVQFAKKSYDAAKIAAKASVKTAKVAGRTLKTSIKVTRTLTTKKGRRGLVKSVKRKVDRIKRNVHRAQKVAKATAKAVKAAAKLTARAVKMAAKLAAQAAKAAAQAIAKLVSLIVETAPWSLLVIAIIAVVILLAYLITNAFGGSVGAEHKAGGWAMGESDGVSEVYDNISELGEQLTEACGDAFANSLKSTITDFCQKVDDPQRIISYNGSIYYTAEGKDTRINQSIDGIVGGVSEYSSERYAKFMATLAVLMTRELNSANTNEALSKFTKADFVKFIGSVNGNSCAYGDTFFMKTTAITGGETCPGQNCKVWYCDEYDGIGCCSTTNEKGETIRYCPGHRYCSHDHTKLTVIVRTVEQYRGKPVAEIYNFSEDEQEQYEAICEFITEILGEMAEENSSEPSEEVNSIQ